MMPANKNSNLTIYLIVLLLGYSSFQVQTYAQEKPVSPKNQVAAQKPSPANQLNLKAQIQKLSTGLRNKNIKQIQASLDGLVALASPHALPPIWNLYQTGRGQQRLRAMTALKSLKIKGQSAQLFQASIRDSLLAVRRAAAEALVASENQENAQALYTKALEDTALLNPIGRFRCVQMLAHIGGEKAAAQLHALLKDSDPQVAAAAAEGIATMGNLDYVKYLVETLGVLKHPEVQPAIADALTQLTGKKNGSNLLKWEQWLGDYNQGEIEPAQQAEDSSENAEKVYRPRYRNPYRVPVTESPIDFVIIFDTTGSLLHIWPEASAALNAVMREMVKQTPSLRLGAIRYRADDARRSRSYVIKPKPLTRNLQEAQDFILDATFGGSSGGLHRGIQYAVRAFTWRANARKIVLIVGDTTPSQSGLKKSLEMITDGQTLDRIQFNALFIRSTHGAHHKSTYHYLAQAGHGRFYEYNKAWSHLVDLSVKKPNVKEAELPMETMKKWLSPLTRK